MAEFIGKHMYVGKWVAAVKGVAEKKERRGNRAKSVMSAVCTVRSVKDEREALAICRLPLP